MRRELSASTRQRLALAGCIVVFALVVIVSISIYYPHSVIAELRGTIPTRN